MNRSRREPINTPLISTVRFPSSLFSLERDEIYPFERLAYNILHVGVEALNVHKLPESIVVDFTKLPPQGSAWTLNASISADMDSHGKPRHFEIATPELFPALLYMFCSKVGRTLFEREHFDVKDSRDVLHQELNDFLAAANAAARKYKETGFAEAVREGYGTLNLSLEDLNQSSNNYDLLTQLISNHEIAHAYALHLGRVPQNQLEARASELVADLLATEWFYNKIIRNTPDTDAYRQFRGTSTHSESILRNALIAQRTQQVSLFIMSLAGAQRTGYLSLEGGATHPPGMLRYTLQHIHLDTLLRSNFGNLLDEKSLSVLVADWDSTMEVFVAAAITPIQDVLKFIDPTEYDVVEKAAELIEVGNLPELTKIVPFLRQLRKLCQSAMVKRELLDEF